MNYILRQIRCSESMQSASCTVGQKRRRSIDLAPKVSTQLRYYSEEIEATNGQKNHT